MLLEVVLALSVNAVPHRELPSTFLHNRVFVRPRVAASNQRLALWVDTDGSGFIRSTVVDKLRLRMGAQHTAYLPPLAENAFPPVMGNGGALPILNDADVSSDPIYSGVDGQLGWTWLAGRIWTIDYIGWHFYQDYDAPPVPNNDRVPLLFDRNNRYPQIIVKVGGIAYRAVIDTAASIAIEGGLPSGEPQPVNVGATSFIPHATMEAWHKTHPDWLYGSGYRPASGVLMIRVPEITIGSVRFHDVWFSTRPDDDVFNGDSVDAKLGPNAFADCAVTLDYVDRFAGFECASR